VPKRIINGFEAVEVERKNCYGLPVTANTGQRVVKPT